MQVNNSCAQALNGLPSPLDVCLGNPAQCSLTDAKGAIGLSFAVWINMPHSFDTQRHYIIDTGEKPAGSRRVVNTQVLCRRRRPRQSGHPNVDNTLDRRHIVFARSQCARVDWRQLLGNCVEWLVTVLSRIQS